MIESKGDISMNTDDLKKKLESMVYGTVLVTEREFGPSIMVEIFPSTRIRFKYLIFWSEIACMSEYCGPEARLDLISKRIVDEYKDAILKRFIKES